MTLRLLTGGSLPLRRQILLLTVLFVCSLPLVTKRIYASDEVQYFSYLRSLWFDRDVSFENEYQHFYDAGVTQYPGFHETFLERMTDTGKRNTFSTIGSALLWSPFYAAADAIVHLRRAMGDAGVAADGYSPPYIAAVAYGSAVYGWLSLVLSLLIVRRVFGDADAGGAGAIGLVAVLAIWFGTPLFFYMYIAPPMAHACSAFAVAAFVLTWLRARRDWSLGGLIALGALAALMAMVREQDLFIAIGPAVDWAIAVWIARRPTPSPPRPPSHPSESSKGARGENSETDRAYAVRDANSVRQARGAREGRKANVRPSDAGQTGAASAFSPDSRIGPIDAGQTSSLAQLLVRGLLGGLAFGVAYLPQLVAYWVINGYPGPSKLVARKLNWLAPHALGVLASPEHGLLFWTPLVVLSIVGLVWLAVRPMGVGLGVGSSSDVRRVAVCVLLMVASQVYIAGSVESWTVAGAFGQRRFVGLTSLFVLGLAALLARAVWPVAEMHAAEAAGAGAAEAVAVAVAGRRGAPRVFRVVCVAAILIGVWWNLGLMAQFGAGLMDRQRLELGRNTYQTFVTIPRRLPELAYRYLFARHSFFQGAPAQTPPAPSPSQRAPGPGREGREP